MARNRGAIGFVTDGCVRDVAGIRALGLPCFAAGVTPNSPARNGPGRVGLPVILGGTPSPPATSSWAIRTASWSIPFAQIDAVIERLDAVRTAEAALDGEVKAGLGMPDFRGRHAGRSDSRGRNRAVLPAVCSLCTSAHRQAAAEIRVLASARHDRWDRQGPRQCATPFSLSFSRPAPSAFATTASEAGYRHHGYGYGYGNSYDYGYQQTYYQPHYCQTVSFRVWDDYSCEYVYRTKEVCN